MPSRVDHRADTRPAAAPDACARGGKPVADPDSYLGLLTRPASGPRFPATTSGFRVDVRTAEDTPWTNGGVPLQIAADGRLMIRGFDSVWIPSSLAGRSAIAGASRPAAPAFRGVPSRSGSPARPVAAALLRLALRVHRPHGRPEPA